MGPVAGHSETTHALERIRSDRAQSHSENQGFIDGDIEAISTGEMGDSYVKVRKVGGEEEAVEEGEEGTAASNEEGHSDQDEKSESESESSEGSNNEEK